jgi:hypothetical protein
MRVSFAAGASSAANLPARTQTVRRLERTSYERGKLNYMIDY